MLIADEKEALHCLKHITYFRLSGYWQIFVNANGKFRANTSCGQMLDIYKFDQELRKLVFGAIAMIEVSLRKEITRKYGLESKVFVAWLHNLTLLRNFCSHHRRIWNHGFAAIVRHQRKISFRKEWNPKSTRIYNSLLAIDHLLGKLPFPQDWHGRLENC